jgi:RNA methyltransferase, TrmH family
MLSKNKIKHINSLKISKYRNLHGEFLVEGTKLVSELSQSDFCIKDIFATKEWLLENSILSKGLDILEIEQKEMKQLSHLTTPPGVLAIVEIPEKSIENIYMEDKFCLMIDGINDPGNLGTIIRTADWFGVDTIFCSPDTVDAYHPKVVQSTMGSVFRVNIFEAELDVVCRKAHTHKITIYGAVMDGESIYETKLKSIASILIIGSESHGIRDYLKPYIQSAITFPSYQAQKKESKAESLNASVATALILAEFKRKNE